MICASVNRFFTSDLPFRMIELSTEVLLKMGGRRRHIMPKTMEPHYESGLAALGH